MAYPTVPWKQTADYDTRIVLPVAQRNVPIASIVIMVLSALLIIMAAVWLAINFHKERSLIYPMVISAKIKTAANSLKSGLTKNSEAMITKVKTSLNHLKFKKSIDNNSDETEETPDNEEEAPVENSTGTSDKDK
jgi:hypothetical protein